MGLTGNVDIAMETEGMTAKLTNASPRIVLAFFGLMIIWRYKSKVEEIKTVTESPNESERFVQGGDDELKVLRESKTITKIERKAFSGAEDISNTLSKRPAIGKLVLTE